LEKNTSRTVEVINDKTLLIVVYVENAPCNTLPRACNRPTAFNTCRRLGVNPVPRTYVRGFGALPLQGGRNTHPRAYARGVLWYGVNYRLKGWTKPSRDQGQQREHCCFDH
jgi:hypothetical protein